eukprot:8895650-Pyramimonas_sp.AAC.1
MPGAAATRPHLTSSFTTAACCASGSSGTATTAAQLRARWLRRPHGEPSGVCTGHMKPQLSGSSFRTVVVRSVVKKAPRCTDRKCEMYRMKFSLSATIVNPDTWRDKHAA